MMISLFGSSIGLALQSACIFVRHLPLTYFLSSRVITGVFSGCAPVAKAYLADVGDKTGNLATYLAWRDAASTLAYILGPVCGGILFELLRLRGVTGTIGSATGSVAASAAASGSSAAIASQALGYVIGISALGSFLATILILSFVQDLPTRSSSNVNGSDGNNSSISTKKEGNIQQLQQEGKHNDIIGNDDQQKQKQNDYEIIACPLGTKLWTGVATVCIISFLYHVADSTFFAFFPALLQNKLQLDARQIGLVFTMLSTITFCFSATSMSSKLISKIGVVNTCALGLTAVGAGLTALSAAAATTTAITSFLVVGAAALYFCGVPLYGPTIPTMLLQCVPPYQRGTGESFF